MSYCAGKPCRRWLRSYFLHIIYYSNIIVIITIMSQASLVVAGFALTSYDLVLLHQPGCGRVGAAKYKPPTHGNQQNAQAT